MRKAVAEKLSTQIAEWGHKGLISDSVQGVLLERYAADQTLGRVLLRWLGFLSVLLLASSMLGFVGLLVGGAAIYLAVPLLGCFAYMLWIKGTSMAVDPLQRYATSGAVLVTFSLFVGLGGLVTLVEILGLGDSRLTLPVLMLVVSAAGGFTACRYGLRWPLLIAVMMAFHGFGIMHRYGGSGSYFMVIQDERITLAVALVAL